MIKLDYKDWLMNQKRLPDQNSDEAVEFYDFHKKLALEGFLMEGEYINPFLYWHLNMWHTEVDVIDERGYISQKYINPYFRDNEWIITNAIDRANKEKKGLAIGGIRRMAKSVLEASYTAWGATFDENSQNVIAGLNSPDIKLITDKLDKGLNHLPWYYKWDRIEDNWKQQVTLGIKSKTGERYPFSYIMIRNLDDGVNEEAIAGTKPRKLIIDEALHEDSLLYTSTGEIKIKDVQIGQKIFGADGKLTKVVDKINPGIVDTYEITLRDGRKLRASGNHIWKVYNTYLEKFVEVTTDELNKKYFFEKRDDRYNKTIKSFIYSIPNNNAVDYLEKQLDIEPYYLGLWLGDGFSSKPNTICSIDNEIINYCSEYGKRLNLESTIRYSKDKHPDFRRISLVKRGSQYNPIDSYFKELNLVNNKHIPDIYLRSSYRQRLELLQGLMDTDGSCDQRGGITFSTSNPVLADNFNTLCRSLGLSVYRKESIPTYTSKGEKKEGKLSYKFSIFTGIRIFKLTRKIDNYNLSRRNNNSKKQMAYKQRCTIIDIKPIGKHQCYCIKVDNDSKLFLTDNFTVTHNCAKGSYLKALMAAIPGFTTPYGWGCSPIITFTGGDAKKFADAQQLMFDCAAFNFLEFDHKDNPNRKHGLFLGHTYRLEGKVDSNFGDYIGNPKLKNVKMQISDEEKADKITDELLEKAKKSNDRNTYLKEKMYYPKNVDDIFLNLDSNIFDVEAAKRQKAVLLQNEFTGTPVVLYIDESGKIKHQFTDKKPITSFPSKPNDDKDAPIVIYEHPRQDPPYGLYIAGCDSYRQGKAKYSTSLGTVYIYKRMNSISGEGYQEMIVASYAARPDKKEVWEEQARLLCKYYNARVVCENDEISFIEYMKAKGDAHMLVKMAEIGWLKEVNANTTVSREYGVHRSSEKNRDYLHASLKKYLEAEAYVEKDENGEITKRVLGVHKVFDPMLLEEIIQYTEDGNFDRLIAIELAIAQANAMEPIYGKAKESREPFTGYKIKKRPALFPDTHQGMFSRKKSKLFL